MSKVIEPLSLLSDDPAVVHILSKKMEIKRRIIKAMQKKGFNRKQTAEFLSISEPRMSSIINNLFGISLEALETVAFKLEA